MTDKALTDYQEAQLSQYGATFTGRESYGNTDESNGLGKSTCKAVNITENDIKDGKIVLMYPSDRDVRLGSMNLQDLVRFMRERNSTQQ